MKIAIAALIASASAFHLNTKDQNDDMYFSKLIGTMTVTAGSSPELSEDASKGIFADQMIDTIGKELTLEQEKEKLLEEQTRLAQEHAAQKQAMIRQHEMEMRKRQALVEQPAPVKVEMPSTRYAGTQSLSFVY